MLNFNPNEITIVIYPIPNAVSYKSNETTKKLKDEQAKFLVCSNLR